MKSIKNYLLAILALATILMVVSCKNEDEVVSYTCEYEMSEAKVTAKVTFYGNGTFRAESTVTYTDGEDLAVAEGTYTGDLNKDGSVITIKVTKTTFNGKEQELSSSDSVSKATIRDNGKKLDFDKGLVYIRD